MMRIYSLPLKGWHGKSLRKEMPTVKNKNKILIVDDSEFNCSLLADILSEDYDLI